MTFGYGGGGLSHVDTKGRPQASGLRKDRPTSVRHRQGGQPYIPLALACSMTLFPTPRPSFLLFHLIITRNSSANMVSTRKHPQDFSTQESSQSSAVTSSPLPQRQPWSHTPSLLTLVWLGLSIPLVIWDSAYVFLRPHSMPGGKFQKPLWAPYELYGQVDHVYGWPAYNSGSGFTAAQSSMNVVEIIGYLYYLYLVYAYGRTEDVQGTGAPDKEHVGSFSKSRTVHGKVAAKALIVLYGLALMTTSKTILYCMSGRATIVVTDSNSTY
jgi:hypothetical protein